MHCPKCKSSEYIKRGKIRERQRYRCRACRYQYTVSSKSSAKSEEIRRMALVLYLEGLGFRAIGSVLKVSYGTVYKWIKKWAGAVSQLSKEQGAKEVGIDELHTYIGSKKVLLGMDCC